MKNIKTLPVERKIYYVLLENFEIILMKIKQNLDTWIAKTMRQL